MAITIRQRNNDWVLEVKEEKWLFKEKSEFDEALRTLMQLKGKYSNIKKEDHF